MASQEHLSQKQAIIDEISGKMESASSVVVIDYIGVTVNQADTMRNRLRDAGVDYKVYKNTLVKRAIDGTGNAQLAEVLEGPSAFAFGFEDATLPARALEGIIKEFKKMGFKAGIVDGVFYDAEGIKQIAAIPPREVLIARFLGSIQSPLGKLVRTFAAIADAQDEGGGDAAEADEAAVAAEAEAEVAQDEAPVEAEAVAEAPAEAEAVAEAPVEAEAAEEAATNEVEAEAVQDEAPAEAEIVAEEAAQDEAPVEAEVAEAEAEVAEAEVAEEAAAEDLPAEAPAETPEEEPAE
jgi:large subunit ribosomal protein L10